MRAKLRLAALLASTALTPTPALATPPVVGFIQGYIAATAGSAIIGGSIASAGFIAGVSASAFLSTGIGAIITKSLLSLGVNAIIGALSPKRSLPTPAERMGNFSQPLSYAQYILGRTRTGGPLGFTGFRNSTDIVTGKTGKKRHYSPILASHPCEGIVTHLLDDKEVTIDAQGTVDSGPSAGYYRIRPFLGQVGQLADDELVACFSEITAAYDFAGLTGAHIWAARAAQDKFSRIYPSGRQAAYAPVIDGAKDVYDPRDGSTGFTRNAALLIAWWIVNILGQSVDWDEVAQEADVSDATVVNAQGGSEPKWRIDGVLNDEQEFEEQRVAMAVACDAWMYEHPDGSIGFKVGGYSEPTVTLTEADFFGVQIASGAGDKPPPAEMVAHYSDPANLYRETPSGTVVLDATSDEPREEVPTYMVTSHNQACRVLTRLGAIRRAEFRISGTLGAVGLTLIGQRFFRLENVLGVSGVFEVDEFYQHEDQSTFDLVAHAVSEADFDTNIQEPERPVFEKVVNDDSVESVAGLTVGVSDGPLLDIAWTAQDESLRQQVRVSESGADDWVVVEAQVEENGLKFYGAQDGQSYDVQVRNRTSSGVPSPWSSSVTVAAIANSTPPAAVTGVGVVLAGFDVGVTFTAPADPNYFATRIFRADYVAGYSGTYDISGATLVRTEYGLPGNEDGFTDIGPPSGHSAYWCVPINPSGVAGSATSPVTIDIP